MVKLFNIIYMYISVDLAHQEIFRAEVGKCGFRMFFFQPTFAVCLTDYRFESFFKYLACTRRFM